MGPSPLDLSPYLRGLKSGLKSSFIDDLQALFKPFFKLIRVKEIRVKDLSPLLRA